MADDLIETAQDIARTPTEAPGGLAPMPAQPTASGIMTIIERAATDPSFDVEKLSRLLDVAERWEANEARKDFTVAMAAFRANAPTIIKKKHVSFGSGKTDYHHATLDAICAACGPIASQHGLSWAWQTEQGEDNAIKVRCVVTHVRGHSEAVTMTAPPDASGSKNAIQAIASTTTYLQRYTLLQALGLAAADDDDGGGATEKISEEERDELVKLQQATGADTKKFLAYLGIEKLDDLPAKRFKEAKAALERKKK